MSKASKQSAGLLMYRWRNGALEVLLVHPGGPYWAKKNEGGWTAPKGEYFAGEEPLAAARREFEEETGFTAAGPFIPLGSVRQRSGKVVVAWAFEGDCDVTLLKSNTCEIEWPPHSNRVIVIPEVDRGAWLSLGQAAVLIRPEQRALLEQLERQLAAREDVTVSP